ncbi:MAG: STAS domain-containing protein [Candidatus Nanopelagicales bacterium]
MRHRREAGDSLRPDLVLPERLDVSDVAEVRYALEVAVDLGVGDVVLDCQQVTVVDTAGLGVLVAAHRRCLQQGRRLVLLDPQPRLLRILAVTRLHRVLFVYRQRPDRVGAGA